MESAPPKEDQAEREPSDKEQMIARLSHLLNNYSDEIPSERMFGDRTHKVSAAWFQDAFSTIRYILEVHLELPELKKKVEIFFRTFIARRNAALEAMQRGEQSDSFVATTKEEIDTMNALLREVMGNMQNST